MLHRTTWGASLSSPQPWVKNSQNSQVQSQIWRGTPSLDILPARCCEAPARVSARDWRICPPCEADHAQPQPKKTAHSGAVVPCERSRAVGLEEGEGGVNALHEPLVLTRYLPYHQIFAIFAMKIQILVSPPPWLSMMYGNHNATFDY